MHTDMESKGEMHVRKSCRKIAATNLKRAKKLRDLAAKQTWCVISRKQALLITVKILLPMLLSLLCHISEPLVEKRKQTTGYARMFELFFFFFFVSPSFKISIVFLLQLQPPRTRRKPMIPKSRLWLQLYLFLMESYFSFSQTDL